MIVAVKSEYLIKEVKVESDSKSSNTYEEKDVAEEVLIKDHEHT